jgi:hypothetical protein
MDPDEVSATDERRGHDTDDPVREGLEHLRAAARELVAAARVAIDACEEIVEDSDARRAAAASVSDFFRTVARSTGVTSPPEPSTDDPEANTVPHDGRTSGVEHIPLDPM